MAELRYSDKDLKEFEDLIHEKLASAREDLDQLQRSFTTLAPLPVSSRA